MFSFIDPASSHAAALSHFHNYAMFFLILVIVFVVWLLKMILKFVVVEKDLTQLSTVESAKLPHINCYGLWFTSGSVSSDKLRQLLFDVVLFAQVTKDAKTADCFQNSTDLVSLSVEVPSMLPELVSTLSTVRQLYPAGNLTAKYEQSYREYFSSVLFALRSSLNNSTFLFQNNPALGSKTTYYSVENYVTTNLYLSGFLLAFKHLAGAKNLAPYTSFKRWGLVSLDVKSSWGFSKFVGRFLYKVYSTHTLPFALFANFYGADSRTFFYLFFQHVRHRKVLEWVWTCLPALLLLMLLYPSLILLYCYDRPYVTKPYLTFKAIGHQWYWSYEYSDFAASADTLTEHVKFDSYMIHQDDLDVGGFRLLEVDRRIVLPIGVCVRLITTSSDVLHSWAVPALGVKIDAVPGRLNQFWIVADRPGTFYGQCSELCGVNHGFMPIAVEGAQFLDFFRSLNVLLAE